MADTTRRRAVPLPLSLSLSLSLFLSLGFIAEGINSAGSLCIPRRNIRAITYRV